MMKKILLLSIAALGISLGVTAQSLPKVGIRAGVNTAKLRTSDGNSTISTEQIANFKIGGYVDFGLAGGFSFQPGVELSGKGGKNVFVSGNNDNYEARTNLMYVEVPVNFLYNIPVGVGKIYLGGGPYAGFGIAGKIKTEGTVAGANVSSERDVNFGSGTGDDLKSTDFGLNFLGGLQLKGGVNVGVNYGLGLSDLAPSRSENSNTKTNNRLVGITIGYFF